MSTAKPSRDYLTSETPMVQGRQPRQTSITAHTFQMFAMNMTAAELEVIATVLYRAQNALEDLTAQEHTVIREYLNAVESVQ